MKPIEKILFMVFQHGETSGMTLNPNVEKDMDGCKDDFYQMCQKEIDMAKACVDLSMLMPTPGKDRIKEIQENAHKSGLIALLRKMMDSQ